VDELGEALGARARLLAALVGIPPLLSDLRARLRRG